MKLSKYIIDKSLSIILIGISYFIILMLLNSFKIHKSLTVAITIVFVLMLLLLFIINFVRKNKFYNELITNVNLLDKKYLVLETITNPSFYEGELLYQALYDINKSMAECVRERESSIEDFKEYVEMWIHEVKIPISSLTLLCHNHKEILDKSYLEQVRKLDNYIDQILYYVRSNYAEEDFIIKETLLEKVVSNVALKNKDDLLESKIDFIVELKDLSVYTDSKWLEFILNQIINNSIKYRRKIDDSFIKIYALDYSDKTVLNICDNGIGIPQKDLSQVFKKSFTGENGRTNTKSTGMGLYIADKLCKKLGHNIEIESEEEIGTEVKIIFGKNNFYRMNV